jgi:hypothetical protein
MFTFDFKHWQEIKYFVISSLHNIAKSTDLCWKTKLVDLLELNKKRINKDFSFGEYKKLVVKLMSFGDDLNFVIS